jgi:hypothetical protein
MMHVIHYKLLFKIIILYKHNIRGTTVFSAY